MISRILVPTDILKAVVEKMAIGSSASSDSFRWVRLEGDGKTVKFFTNTNHLDTEIQVTDVSAHDPFSFEVSGPLFKNLASLLPDRETEILSGDGVQIRSGKAEFRLANRHPDLQVRKIDLSSVNLMTIDMENLFRSFAKVSHASGEGHKPYQEAVTVWGPKLYASDGYRLAAYPNTEINHAAPILLKTDLLSVLARIYKGVGTIGGLAVTDSALILSCGGVTTSLRRMNATPPGFENVIPRGDSVTFRAGKDDLQSALSRCLVVADDKAPMTRIYFDNGVMRFESEGLGNVNRDEVECGYSGSATSIVINPTYMLQAVRSVNDNTGGVTLQVRGSSDALVITDEQGEHINVIVPIRA